MHLMHTVICRNLQIYPEMLLEDVYKLIYQAALGCEHAVSDEVYAKSLLEQELQELQPSDPEALVESISPDGSIIRVHLRPYVQSGKDPLELFEAFLRTARDYQGSFELLKVYMQVVLGMAEAETIPYEERRVINFFKEIEQGGFPPVHHSKRYRELYRPAYRVIHPSFFPTIFDV
jgi:hypothetical protein